MGGCDWPKVAMKPEVMSWDSHITPTMVCDQLYSP